MPFQVIPAIDIQGGKAVRLRRRFERDPDRPVHFHTIRGVGYRFTKEPTPG